MPTSIVSSFIAGKACSVANGHRMPVIDPASEDMICELREADAAEVDRAVVAARRAFPAWAAMPAERRNDILYAIHDIIRLHAQELAELEVRNAGLPIVSVRHHVDRAAANFRTFAEVASTLAGETYSQADNYLTYVTREARGVAALISPWNAPLALSSMRVATCIAFGNTCVLKPSEYTPLSAYRMIELMGEAGLPDGVVNLVNGRGAVTGEALVGHPDINMVGFTGGTATGKRVMATAGANLTPTILELGGKSANIVFADADIDQAIDGTLLGIYANNGQQCLAGSRILVQRSVADRFITSFVERAKRIHIDDPMREDTELGPLAFAGHRRAVMRYIDIALSEGGELLTGGGTAGYDKGFYLEPIAVLAKSNDSRVCQEEIFGPFATFVVFDDLDDAIRMANKSSFGLVAYVWTSTLVHAMRCSREVSAGTVWINTPMMRELRAPFGGVKQSGVGRDGARSSAEFFTELKATTIPITALTLPRLGLRDEKAVY